MWTGYEREGGARRGSNVKGVLGQPPLSGNRKAQEDLRSRMRGVSGSRRMWGVEAIKN